MADPADDRVKAASVARRACCDVEVYTRDDSPGLLLPAALRINGKVVLTPKGTKYTATGGDGQPLTLTLEILPTSLKFLPGPPPAPEGVQ